MMGNSEAKGVCKTEEQVLGLGTVLPPLTPSASSPPTAPMESLTAEFDKLNIEEKPEEKSEWSGTAGEVTGRELGADDSGWNIEPSGWGDDDDEPTKDFPVLLEDRKDAPPLPPPVHYPLRPGEPEGKSEWSGTAGEVTRWELGADDSGWNIEPSGWGDDDDEPTKDFPVLLEDRKDAPLLPPPVHYPLRPGVPDCVFYVKSGSCKFGMNCKFNHPGKKRRKRVRVRKVLGPAEVGNGEAKVVSNTEVLGLGLSSPSPPTSSVCSVEPFTVESKNLMENLDRKFGRGGDQNYTGLIKNGNLLKDSLSSKEGKNNGLRFPIRPDKTDCSYYLKVGNCQFGSNCKFNHPPTGKVVKEKQNQSLSERRDQKDNKVVKEKQNQSLSERRDQKDNKHHPMARDYKTAEVCKDANFQGKAELAQVELNFLGLPIRPGERECPYYMSTGGCKFATNCCYHHPDPTAVVGQDPVLGFQSGGPQHLSGTSAPPMTSWPFPINSSEPVPYFDAGPSYTPGFYPLPPQGLYPNPEWNGYQVPVPVIPWVHPDMNTTNFQASTTTVTGGGINQHSQVDEYPDRPGQPECHY